MRRTLTIATRASPLAMVQARSIARRLRRLWPRFRFRILPLTASADIDLQTPLYGMGGIGVFSTVVHQAILAGQADIGVHSCKDLPTTPPDGMARPVLPRRADPRDCLLGASSLAQLATEQPEARIGSSSLRRRQQLAALGPRWQMVDLRGNVQTRLRKMSEGEADVTILAAAGLRRLGLRAATQAVPLHPVHELIPAPAQGALAVDVRFGDTLAERLVQPLGDHETTLAVQAEREILAGLRGGCSLPLGCYVWRYRSLWRAAARLDPGLDPSREPAQNLDQKPDQILGLAKANAASARVVHYAGAYGTLVDTVLADLQAP